MTSKLLDQSREVGAVVDLMFDCLSRGNPIYLPSKFWEVLNKKNIEQLESEGIENFKQTVAQNYFTWVIGPEHEQFRYLVEHTSSLAYWLSVLKGTLAYDSSSRLTREQQTQLTIFTRMLWKLAERSDTEKLLQSLEEPLLGNPFKIFLGRKLISQDLANSILEYYSIKEHFAASANATVTICELGAGYGRNAYVFMNAFPNCKYIVVDIPPALYTSQYYLTSVFPNNKVFKFRCFDDFAEVATEFQDSNIAFLLPHQAEMLPRKSVDLFVNISSLHEMRIDQIRAYFLLIDRLTKGHFYSKQWFVSENPYDKIYIKHDDYPVPDNWRQLYLRQAKVQLSFFEAMYAIDPPGVA